MDDGASVIYWDASALISSVIMDRHSDTALAWVEKSGLHLISTLADAEISAVISRMKKEGLLTATAAQTAFETLGGGPWRHIGILPESRTIRLLSEKWPLRGADLWHLAAAKTLHREFPELVLLSFDQKLQHAAEGESLGGVVV
ncbi:MAG: type II toxin-antitoxin system VapC family toxin [Desulfobacterales bacterium]|nr:type II toxin-antitoxin system VapC family toxin [Desulfobacterales bacterium]